MSLNKKLVIAYKKWIYCLDCGLLVEPWTPGKKRFTICNICKQVYTQVTHPWLKKMLAYHLTTSSCTVYSLKNFFVCKKCGNFFVDKNQKKIETCKWCALLSTKSNLVAKECVFCKKTLSLRYNTIKVICKECLKNLEEIKAALKYTHYILMQTKQKKQQPYIALSTEAKIYDYNK